jgi:hypothetical protein
MDPFDPDQLRLPDCFVVSAAAPPRPPRHRPGEAFIKGPIPFAWLSVACRLPGSGFSVAMTIRYLRGRFARRRAWGVAEVGRLIGASEWTARRGLQAAERAGLLSITRGAGCRPALDIADPPAAGPRRPPLYGPIPWAWWASASRLPGLALQVAAACWCVAGWERSATIRLALATWAELGLSRFSAGRGLRQLESAGLVLVDHRAGRPPTVTLVRRI